MPPIIVNSESKEWLLANCAFLQSELSRQNVRFVSSLQNCADLVIPCFPASLAICIVESNEKDLVAKLDELQRGFRLCAAVVLCPEDDDSEWKLLNIRLSGGVLRLIQVRRLEDISTAIEKVYDEMCPTDTIDMMKAQARYFDSRLSQLTSAKGAKSIYHRSLNKLAVPSKDISLLQNRFNSHMHLVTAQIQDMKEECPASVESIYKVYYFFTSKKDKKGEKEEGYHVPP